MFEFLKNIIEKINKLDGIVNKYKEEGGEVSMPSYAYMNWGIKLLDDGNEADAIEVLKKSAQMPYTNADTYVNLGIAFAKRNDFENALECFKKATRLDNSCFKAYQMMGSVYSELDDNEQAKKSFQISIKLNPRNPQVYLNRAIFYAKIGKPKNANQDFKTTCFMNPSNSQSWFLWGVLCAQQKEYDAAIHKFLKTLSIDAYYKEAHFHLASASFLKKDYANAMKYAKKAVVLDKSRTENYIVLAESWLHLGNEEECFKTYKNAPASCSLVPSFLYSWGISFQYFEKWSESVEKLNEASKIDPKNHLPYFALALAYFKLEDDDNALAMLLKTTENKSDHTLALYNLGQLYSKRQEYEKSIEYFKRAIDSTVDSGYIYINVANVYELMKSYEDALIYWKKAEEYNPSSVDTKISLANAYLRAGDIQNALRKIRGIYKDNKTNPKVLSMYGVLLANSNEYYEALEKFDELLKIDANNEIASVARIECYAKLHRPNEAQKVYEELMKTENKLSETDKIYLKLIIDTEYIEKEGKIELIEPSLKICDKIISLNENQDAIKSTKTYKEKLIKIKEA